MRKLLIALGAAGALLLALALLGSSLFAQMAPPSFDPVAYERQQLAIERARAVAPVETLAAQVAALLPVAFALLLLVLLAAFGGAAVLRFFRERRPDAAGLLPVVAEDQHTARAALAGFHAARLEEARRALTPQTLTYSPSFHHRSDGSGIPLLPADVTATAPAPTFAQLLDAGRIGKGNPMLLGYDAEGRPVEGSWLDLYSCAVGGLSGSGKTWTATFLAAQAALYGSELVLLDPHAGNAESLAARLAPMRGAFRCAPAESPREMLAAVELVAAELDRRKAGARGPGLLFICDEFSALQRGALAEPLAGLVEALGQEGRKLGIYAMVAGQVWSGSRAGGTELRASLASAYVHRLRPAQARMLTGMTAADLPADLLELPAGAAYLLDTAGDFRRVTIPQMTPADVARVAELLGGVAPSGPASATPSTMRPIGFRPGRAEGATEGATEGAKTIPLPRHQGAAQLTPEEAGILAAFLSGKTPSELAEQLAGTTGGRKYAEASRRVADILRRALGAPGVQHG